MMTMMIDGDGNGDTAAAASDDDDDDVVVLSDSGQTVGSKHEPASRLKGSRTSEAPFVGSVAKIYGGGCRSTGTIMIRISMPRCLAASTPLHYHCP